MMRRYTHLAAEHLVAYADNTECHGTNTAQIRHKYGTTSGFLRHSLIASIGKIKNLMWPGVELNHRHADFQSLLQIDLSYCLHYKK
jgi:hypothetical protein